MFENGIKEEFGLEDINLKDINMHREFKARGLEEIIKEKRGDPGIKHECFQVRVLGRTLSRCSL